MTGPIPAPGVGVVGGMGMGLDPKAPGLPLLSTTARLQASTTASIADPADQLANAMRTAWNVPVVDGDRVLSSPRHGLGYVAPVTGEVVAEWARTSLPSFRHLTDADAYGRAAQAYCTWARQAEADRLTRLPADQRRADELRAERTREERRAALQRQQAEAARELAELDRRTTS